MSNDALRPHQYGRHTDRAPGNGQQRAGRARTDEQLRPYRGEQYYGLPVVKASPWGWLITSYFFVGGLAGAAQLIATIAELFGGQAQRPVVRAGRYLALAGVFISPVLLILDLHRPARWYNMLRIARLTSPMSIGSWILSAFGISSSIAAVAVFVSDRTGSRRVDLIGRVAGSASGVSGAAMATYTALLLSSTSIPLWLTAHRYLPTLFGSTAMASAIAAISLTLDVTGTSSSARRPLTALALLASAVQIWSSKRAEHAWQVAGIQSPLQRTSFRLVDAILIRGAGILFPSVVHLAMLTRSGSNQMASILAACGTLIGSFAERWLLVNAGNASATQPADYFAISQPAPPRDQS